MKKREFKSESKRLLDLMINSIYTNKEIFLRELISNASDALDKLYYLSLTDNSIKVNQNDLKIMLDYDKDKRTITITDNGCGMNEEELENNLGTIAKSGSLSFKEENKNQNDVDIIGQFGVGFYSAFMVSKEVEVYTRKYNEEEGYLWKSSGVDGYTVEKCKKEDIGTKITLYLKDDTDDDKYSDFLSEYRLKNMVKKYSDYIRYPIMMKVENSRLKEGSDSEYETVSEIETLNSRIPLWKNDKSKITTEEYNNFYTDKFYDYEAPLKVIHFSMEGTCSFKSLLFIPSHAPYDLYTKEYKKGLQLYSSGVLIMDKCEELLPDYYSFVKGVVDTDDLSLNISREMLQQDKKLKLIGKNIESKIKKELEVMLKDNFEEYKKFFKTFGMQIKFGVYNNYGIDKDKLKDLLIFYSANKKDFITLKQYVDEMKKDQDSIYYANGETIDKIDLLPQVERVKDKKYDILYLTDYVDEFAIKALMEYEGKKFANVSDESLELDSKKEIEALKKINEDNKTLLDLMKEDIGSNVTEVRFTHRLKSHPVCLTTKGGLSIEMEKVLNAMPTDEHVNASVILEINESHPIAAKLKDLYNSDKEEFKKYSKVLYAQARLIEGLTLDNPTEISNLMCDIMTSK
ncbi:MAG: molecular chaperone HtpG [Firmicutes bacterium]|nr:molecular chaperone HtpG [Bacillota bacterium]